MKKKMWISIAFLALVACLGIIMSGSTLAAPEDILVVGMEADAYSMDPLVSWMTYGMVMMNTIYDKLLRRSPTGDIEPCLATSYELLNDNHWRFHLRKGVKFHNGYPFTAADAKFTIERIMDPKNKCRYRSRYLSIDKIVAVDDYTMDVITKQPDPMIASEFAAFPCIVSKKWVEENEAKKLGKQAMGTGPFKFVSWKRKDRLVLDANTEHFMNVPKVKKLVFRPIPEESARLAELQAGGVHIITNVPPFLIPQLKKNPTTTYQNVLSLRSMYMGMDTLATEPLKDKRVRLAINYAVDKELIIKGLLKGLGKPMGIGAPLMAKGLDKSIKPYPFNPEKSKTLLKEAGYGDGFELELYSPSQRYPMDKEVTQAVADQLGKVGIKCKVNVLETQKYFKGFAGHTLGGLMFLGLGYTQWDIQSIIMTVNPKAPFSYYHDPKMTELVEQQQSLMDIEARYKVAQKLQRLMHEAAVNLELYNQENTYGLSSQIQGFEARPDDFMDLWTVSLSK